LQHKVLCRNARYYVATGCAAVATGKCIPHTARPHCAPLQPATARRGEPSPARAYVCDGVHERLEARVSHHVAQVRRVAPLVVDVVHLLRKLRAPERVRARCCAAQQRRDATLRGIATRLVATPRTARCNGSGTGTLQQRGRPGARRTTGEAGARVARSVRGPCRGIRAGSVAAMIDLHRRTHLFEEFGLEPHDLARPDRDRSLRKGCVCMRAHVHVYVRVQSVRRAPRRVEDP
jgi:hypothetical protein